MNKLVLLVVSAVSWLFASYSVFAKAPNGIAGNVTVVNEVTDPVPVNSTNTVRYSYAGNTAHITSGQITNGAGLVGLGAATSICQAEFGSDARMATPLEAIEGGASQAGWVNARIVEYALRDDPFFTAYDPETTILVGPALTPPMNALRNAHCVGWSSASNDSFGPASVPRRSVNGVPFYLEFCDAELPIACSVPVSVPVGAGQD